MDEVNKQYGLQKMHYLTIHMVNTKGGEGKMIIYKGYNEATTPMVIYQSSTCGFERIIVKKNHNFRFDYKVSRSSNERRKKKMTDGLQILNRTHL